MKWNNIRTGGILTPPFSRSGCHDKRTWVSAGVCVSLFPAGRLSEKLLSKLQHVVFAVMQEPLIQICFRKTIKGNFLEGREWQSIKTWLWQDGKGASRCVFAGWPQLSDRSRVQPWWRPLPRRQLKTRQTAPLHLEAPTFGPAAATGSRGERRVARTQPGKRQSGRTRRQTSTLRHEKDRYSWRQFYSSTASFLIAICFSSDSRPDLYLLAFPYHYKTWFCSTCSLITRHTTSHRYRELYSPALYIFFCFQSYLKAF